MELAETFEEFVQRERERLQSEREKLQAQQRELDMKLREIETEYGAVAAYEKARTGRKAAKSGAGGTGSRARKGSRREALMELIRGANGLSRGEILEKMGLKGDRAGEMSVSNALTALTKGNQVRRDSGKYLAAS